jgi:branched-chain amino acid aminotransferase
VLKDNVLYTTDTGQGAVEGVMQSWWIDRLAADMTVSRGIIVPDILQEADEVFLTNALFGIRWVGRIGEREYGHTVSHRLFQEHLRTIFH